ncbi:hypothetical protein PENSPDRAFT_625212 [Peniophora sp. CONT]|nr:hypothetical protein PENSPDRAFT_625212 [Peniophora sp. CONT]
MSGAPTPDSGPDDQDVSPTSPFIPSNPASSNKSSRFSTWGRRRPLILPLIALSFLSLSALALYSHSGSRVSAPLQEDARIVEDSSVTPSRLSALLGPPASRFRDNLRNDTLYIHSFISAGWTNDVMTYANLIYLGLITGRVPIVNVFNPSHVGVAAGSIPFDEVFDLDVLSENIGLPVLQWHEVKDPDSEEIEEIGCWNIWEAVQNDEHYPRIIYTLGDQGLDVSWTTAPSSIKLYPDRSNDRTARFWDMASLTYKYGRERSLVPPTPSKEHGVTLPPDEHLACFDYLYYSASTTADEFYTEISPAWRFVATHMHFTPELQNLADGYLRRMFGVTEDEDIPQYITIHARRGDFKVYCRERGIDEENCFPTIEDYVEGITNIQDALEARLGIRPQHVVMVSDETNEGWWASVRLMGWYTPDHIEEKTEEQYGIWYPVLIDAVIQSSGVGLLGTPGSTMSLIAGRRVMDWYHGEYYNVRWEVRYSQGGPALM